MAKQVTRYASDAVTLAEATYNEGTFRDGEATPARRCWWENSSSAAETLENCQVAVESAGGDGATFLQLAADQPLTPPNAPVGAAASGMALEIGDYRYRVTFVSANGETIGGTISGIVTTTEGVQHVNLSGIPLGPAGTTARRIYRTEVGGSTYLLVATLSNNSTTNYADATPDDELGAAAPTVNTSGAPGTWGIAAVVLGDLAVGDYGACWMRFNFPAGTSQAGNPRAAYAEFQEG